MTTALETLNYNLRRKAPRTADRYLGICRQYLEFSTGDMSRMSMLRFMEQMEKTWAPNTRRLAHYALAKLCRALEVKFPLDADDLAYPPSRDELRAPFLAKHEVESLIVGWRNTVCWETSLLFLSSIYGCRSVEMTNVDIDQGSLIIHIAKKRGGLNHPKKHLIPDGCQQFLGGYSHQTEWNIIQAYHRVASECGVSRDYGAWHMIRRSLNTGLQLGGINPEILTRFIGWEKSPTPQGASPMASVYFHMADEDIDREVFEKHPFLGMWNNV